MSDDSDLSSPITKKPKRKPLLESSSDSSSGSESSPIAKKCSSKNKNHIHTSESDSSIEKPRKKQRVYKVAESETDSSDTESSDSEILVNKKIITKTTGTKLFSDSESFSENSYSESENYSDSSDGQSEKCPICLLKFKNQEIGSPETCDHIFCFECLQAWSQNVNTCPVDRQTFSLILVRKEVNGKIIRQVTVESKTEAPEPPEDPTFCEICGQSDREDRLLLCDGCDLGYHLECLDPPLEFVPLEEWFCQICIENDQILHQNYRNTSPRNAHNSTNSSRLIPRTSQTERVRTQIAARRIQIQNFENIEIPHQNFVRHFTNSDQVIELGSNSSGFESFGGGPGSSSTRRNVKKSVKRGRRSKKRRSRTYYFDIDENTGEKIKVYRNSTKRKTRKRRKRVSKRRQKTVKNVAKTVKKRLAAQLGFCAPQKCQNVSKTPNCNIAMQRSHAGIPALHLFGQRDQLDYFSDEDFENSAGGINLITSSTRQITDVLAARRAARRKMAISTPPTINSVDILGSILSEQSKLHSKNTTLSVTSDGTLKIESNLEKTEKIDLKNVEVNVVQAPMFPNRNNSNNRPYFRGGSHSNYHGNSSNYDGGLYYQNYSRGAPRGGNFSSNNQNYSSYHNFGSQNYGTPNFGPPHNFRGRGPIRFPMRRPQILENQNENLDFYEGGTAEPTVTQNENENVDIYSDIEEGGPNDDGNPNDDDIYKNSPPRNLEPAPIPDFEGHNSSENEDLVIDDSEKYDPADPSHDSDDNSQIESQKVQNSPPEEGPDFFNESQNIQPSSSQIRLNVTRVPTVSKELLKEAVKEVLHEHLDKKKTSTISPEGSDDDDCPNFSIYSAESIDIAKKTDSEILEPQTSENYPKASKNCQSSTENEPKIDEYQENTVRNDENLIESDEIAKNSAEIGKNLDEIDQDSINIAENNSDCDQNCGSMEEKLVETENEDAIDHIRAEIEQKSDEINQKESEIEKGGGQNEGQLVENEEQDEPVSDLAEVSPTQDKISGQNLKKSPIKVAFDPTRKSKPEAQAQKQILSLYDDSDLEEWVPKADMTSSANTNDVTELEKMTEAISEEERSYTPCLDEKEPCTKNFSEIGISGLDTEMISDDERNDFDFQNDNSKTNFENFDALEINAKESELDLAKPEDYEEGEIIEKSKIGTNQNSEKGSQLSENAEKICGISSEKQQSRTKNLENNNVVEKIGQKPEKVSKTSEKLGKNRQDKDDEHMNTSLKKSSEKFKKFSKKERNYRDKENRGRSVEKSEKTKKSAKKERKQDLERYCVRSLMADKPRKDQFGRDLSDRNRSLSREKSPSFSPRRSRSISYERSSAKKARKRRNSRSRKSRSFSRSPRRRSRSPRRSKSPRISPNRKRKTYRSISRDRENLKSYRSVSREKNRYKVRQKSTDRKKSRKKSRSPCYNKRFERNRSFNRDWSPSPFSRSPSPRPKKGRENREQSFSPGWTPPLENRPQENLTVILKNNEKSMKKREKRKKGSKNDVFRSKKRRNNTPPPSKEVFASGDNILVSVSFNKPSENDDIGMNKKRGSVEKKSKKPREKRTRRSSPSSKFSSSKTTSKKNSKTANNIKPVAIIDLENSPFKELTPSPKDIIILSDSDAEKSEKNNSTKTPVPNQALSETLLEKSPNYASGGPKTPPEPQIKFLISKQTNSLRPILNPLHDPAEQNENEGENEISEGNFGNKGPNTPPEPPNSPPSSPDAYDPFEPTKSRSPTPEPEKTSISNEKQKNDAEMSSQMSNVNENMSNLTDLKEKSGVTPENTENGENKNEGQDSALSQPERISVVINQQVQQANVFPTVKPLSNLATNQQSTQIITSTPTLSTNSSLPRTNLFNTPTLGNTSRIIVLPTTSKNSPAKMSPAKLPIKSTPIKPMQSSKTMISKLPVPNVKPLPQPRKSNQNKSQNNQIDVIEVGSDFESPYSPGSSDFEDLFEPPVEISSQTKNNSSKNKNTSNLKSPAKNSANQSSTNNFDNLFASSPIFRNKNQLQNNNNNSSSKKNSASKKGNKKGTPQKHNKTHVGVKLDEDNLKILDDLPNSAVEMQVKDKFLKKLNRQERVVEEVKHVLKPHYNKKHITKEQYKDILRRAVPKICHNKSGEINPKKIQNLIEAYVKRARHQKKAANNSGQQQQNQQAAQNVTKPAKTTFWS